MVISDLFCQQLKDPQGISTRNPELSWELAEPSRGSSRQEAWRVVVDLEKSEVESGRGVLWDSGRVAGRQTCGVLYGGRELESRLRCYWKVWSWDESGVEHESGIGVWSMGLLEASDWVGYWIGKDSAPEYPADPFKGARWIWSDRNLVETVKLETEFELAESAGEQCQLWVMADGAAEIFLNGKPICRATRATANLNNFPIPQPIEVFNLYPGCNRLLIEATKADERSPYAGVILRLCVGEKFELVTSPSWVANGVPVRDLGSFGASPWHRVPLREYPNLSARYLRRTFCITKPVRRAVLYYSGLGLAEAWLNGVRIGDAVLSPHATDYAMRVPYQTFEVTEAVRMGGNAIGCILGNGRFFASRVQVPCPMENYGVPRLLLQLEINYEDGLHEVIVSDPSWLLSVDGAIGWNSEFDGEVFDARRDESGWSLFGFDDSRWDKARIVAAPQGRLHGLETNPIRAVATIQPKDSWTSKYGTTIIDFGENLVGWCRCEIRGKEGSVIRLQHSEALDSHDALALDNLRSALCTDTVILREGGTSFEPRFTCHGFRYVEIRGLGEQVVLEDIEARFVHDDVPTVGAFTCSNGLVNRIVDAAGRGIIGNYRSMPMDCPQRDERMGWLGDRAGSAAGEMFLYDVRQLYRKWMEDIRLAQAANGCVPDIAPPFWKIYSDNVTWPSCLVFIPHWLFRHYGDSTIVQESFAAIRKWLDHLSGYLHQNLIDRDVYGDWCVPPETPRLIHSERPDRKTSPVILASCYFARNLEIAAGFAYQMGEDAVADKWLRLRKSITLALNARFLNNDGSYDNGSQTSTLLPLAFDLAPEQERRRIFDALISRLTESGEPVLGTGLVGGQWLLRTLTRFGRADLAARLVIRETYPSWGYMIRHEATTIWELWNGNTADPSMNSGNHVMLLGDLLPWLFEDVAGIQAARPGFERIRLRPSFLFKEVDCRHRSVRGVIESSWKYQDDRIVWETTIPPNVEADVELPASLLAPTSSRVDWIPALTGEDGVTRMRAIFGPGRHSFSLPHPDDFPFG